jgi:tRNA pseudouridine(55) synthase
MSTYPKYATIEKTVGETPLVTLERLRSELHISKDVPLAYAGRLDPMASGKLLILIGDECKKQEQYHSFDKEYIVEILLGARSDTGDVLGFIEGDTAPEYIKKAEANTVLRSLRGIISFPYPNFSSKTVYGKPLHTWTLENRLHEIEIPMNTSCIHSITLRDVKTVSRDEILKTVRAKIETIPPVTDERKALGADFRRNDVRESWNDFERNGVAEYQILTISCIASSGTYMRSLAGKIGEELNTYGLAYSIHRTTIGTYMPLFKNMGFWLKRF